MRTRARQTVVVGGSRGIGRHLALLAARRGDSVVVCARDQVALDSLIADAEDASLETLSGDFLSSGAHLDVLVDRIVAHPAPRTVLVCAASIGPVGALLRVDIDRWAEALQINVVGSARIIARVLPHLGARDLVVLFSGGGVGGPRPQPHVSSYSTSKVALTHLTEVVASENPGGPVIVAIAPGAFPTDFTSPVLEAPADLAGEALLADVARTRALSFEAAALERLLNYLEEAPRPALSGRTLSARRDTLDFLASIPAPDPNLLRLRRVDGDAILAAEPSSANLPLSLGWAPSPRPWHGG